MAHEPLIGYVEFRTGAGASGTRTEAHFHADVSCRFFRDHSTAQGPMLLGNAQRYRGLDVCSCAPSGGVHPTSWRAQGSTFLYG